MPILKDVDSRVFTRMLRKDGSVIISLRNFVGEGIINVPHTKTLPFLHHRASCLETGRTRIPQINMFSLCQRIIV